ncbi:MAG TPA: YciI family protein [Polyangia bacterium]|nr:YciI family protein [Polyangia bacterium]
MRVMMIVKASKDSEAGMLPTEAHLALMGKYNEELQKAGVLLDLSGLKPTSAGTRVRFGGGKPTVVDGPFTEAKELIAGYWVIQVKSKEEAIEWAKRIPAVECNVPEVELRPFYELEDFAPGAAVDAAKELGKKLPANTGSKS